MACHSTAVSSDRMMPGKTFNLLPRMLVAAGALGLGMLAGRFSLPVPGGRGVVPVEENPLESPSPGIEGKEEGRLAPNPRETASNVTFSRLQWSKLMSNAGIFKVPLLRCLTDPTTHGSGSGKPSLDLYAQAYFLGWDEQRKNRVQSELQVFGTHLAEAEKQGTIVTYPATGGVRFDFSASQHQREQILSTLKTRLAEILGKMDAERFGLLSGLPGLNGELPAVDVIQTRFITGSPGPQSTISPFGRKDYDFSEMNDAYVGQRYGHTGIKVDWNRVSPEAPTSAAEIR